MHKCQISSHRSTQTAQHGDPGEHTVSVGSMSTQLAHT